MPEYRFTPEARDDLQSIVDYTQEHWGKDQAHKYVDGLEEMAAHLAEKPSLGVNRDTLISRACKINNLLIILEQGISGTVRDNCVDSIC